MRRTFLSAVGIPFWTLLTLSSLLLFLAFWYYYYWQTVVIAVFIIFQIEALVHTEYVVQSDGWLRIRSGRFMPKFDIKIDAITKIETITSLAPAPALSMHRLKIYYTNIKGEMKVVMISPRNPEAFRKAINK